jgi:hypothetical protein
MTLAGLRALRGDAFSPRSHSAYWMTLSAPVLVRFSIASGLLRRSSTLPRCNRSPRSARRLAAASSVDVDVDAFFAFSRAFCPSTWRVLKSELGWGLAVLQR